MADRYVETIEAKGWCLYDVSDEIKQRESWELREQRRSPTLEIESDKMYMFVPQAQEHQTLREAYAVTMGIGPCLRIRDPDLPEYKSLLLRFSPRFAFFSRIAMNGAEVILFTPETPELPYSDLVVLESSTAESTFVRDFDVITPAKFQAELVAARQSPN